MFDTIDVSVDSDGIWGGDLGMGREREREGGENTGEVFKMGVSGSRLENTRIYD